MKYRLHLKNKRRFLSLMSFLGILVILFASILSAGANSKVEPETEFFVVKSGDTMWEIATHRVDKGDIRSYIADVRHLNGMDNNTIYAGQGLLLPVR